MLSLNEVQIAGAVTQEVDVRSTENGKYYCQFNVATNSRIRDTKGTVRKIIDNHRCVIFGEAARTLEKMCKQGTNILVKGELKTRAINTMVEGSAVKQEVTEIRVSSFQVIANGKSSDAENENILSYSGFQQTPQADDSEIPFF